MWKPKITWPITWRPILPFSSKLVRKAGGLLLHVLLPNTCYACCRDMAPGESAALCSECEAAVRTVGPRCCARCGKPLPDGGAHCRSCRRARAQRGKCALIRSAVVFGPQIRPVIHAFKYADARHLSAYLSGWMARQWKEYPELAQAQVMMPVPLHRKKLRARGYNQSSLLARSLAEAVCVAVDETSLVRTRNTPSQTGFGREGRLQNMSGAFACVDPAAVKGKVVLLVDDVATTGATLEGCAQTLRAAGAKKVMAYTLAREL